MFKLLSILPCLFAMFQPLNAKVDPPNYDFSLDALSEFFPDKVQTSIDSKYGKGDVMTEDKETKIYRYYVAHIRYKFPVMIQTNNGVVTDFFARLPNYFLHDLFFQSLVNKYGKQTTYKKVGEEAVYTWDLKPLKHVYSAACTITCFPIFYSVEKVGAGTSQLQKMQKASRQK